MTFLLQSLTTRVMLLALTVVMAGMWSLSLYAGRMLRIDMQHQLGDQQFSTASVIAGNIDRELGLRQEALQQISATVAPTMLDQPLTLQNLMARLPVFQSMFKGGTFATRLDGVPVASVSAASQPTGRSTADTAQLAGFLASNADSLIFVSESNPPDIRMAVPLRTAQGQVIGALVGVIDIGASNFLDNIKKSSYGKTGGYRLYSPKQGRVIMASERQNAQESPPVTDQRAAVEWDLRQQEGTTVSTNPHGQEVLVSNKATALGGWIMSVILPTEEAFTPVREQQRRLLTATLLATALAVSMMWLIVRHQLLSLESTVKTLARLADSDQPLQPLPLTRQYEMNQLVGGFNRLLATLTQRNEALKASITLNHNTLDSIATQIAVLGSDGRVLAINESWRQFAAHASGSNVAMGSAYPALFPPSHEDVDNHTLEISKGIQSVLGGCALSYTVEYALQTEHSTHWFYLGVTPLGPKRQGVVISRSDITERKLIEEQLRNLSQVAQQAPLSIVITNLRGNIEYTNPYFSDKTGYAAHEVQNLNPRVLKSGMTPPKVYDDLWQTLSARQVWRGELHNRKKNGDLFVEHAVIAPVLDLSGQVTHYVALKEDITEAKQAEKNRLGLSLRIEEISRHLVRTQEETRQRFSQELHDRTSPNLAALRINLSIITRTIQKAPGGLEFDQNFADRIDDTRALIDDTNASIREICAGLHPAAIERAGLLSVVQNYAHQFVKRTAIQVRVSCPHNEIRLHADLELTLFRIVQEALTNCAKHAHAQTVDVRMRLDSHPVLLSVSDDGCGFELQPSTGRAPFHGLGLINMRETVEFAGGSFKLESAPGFGTRIYVEI